jgi:hypothetical protein
MTHQPTHAHLSVPCPVAPPLVDPPLALCACCSRKRKYSTSNAVSQTNVSLSPSRSRVCGEGRASPISLQGVPGERKAGRRTQPRSRPRFKACLAFVVDWLRLWTGSGCGLAQVWATQVWATQTALACTVGNWDEAARAYDCAAVQAQGPGTKRNFPDEAISELPTSNEQKADAYMRPPINYELYAGLRLIS